MRTPIDLRRLTRRRVEAGLSQAGLARKAGVSRSLVNAVSQGKASFSPETLAKIAAALDCRVADLLPEDDDAFHAQTQRPA
ncbi:helix-turn-helix transcriptional regulator [Streptomyces sp. 1222.5]|uniref:helix-turn-helix transcriptional regulator n=1 Tax=Streptomyces sp. 1222.5 TaxID=1881026 RepID=UPI003D72E3EB